MPVIDLLFSTRATAGAALIRAATWSRWSHVALLDGDTVIESTWPHGVQRTDALAAVIRAREAELVEVPCRDPAAILAAAASQLGKPYDSTAILGLGLHRDWQEDDAWFCSELVAWAFQQAGEPLFRADSLRRVTPQHLWMLPPAPRLSIGRA